MGSLNGMQFEQYYQNVFLILFQFTKRDFNYTVAPNGKLTLAYRFATYIDLEPGDYILALTVFYETLTDEYATTFFNQTVTIHEERSKYDFQTISSFVFLFLIIGFILYLFLGNKKGHKTTGSAEKTTVYIYNFQKEEWLKETLIDNSPEKPKKGKGKKDKSKDE